MELLVRYGEALGAERFVDTNNVAGVPGTSNLFLEKYYSAAGRMRYDVDLSRSSISTATRSSRSRGSA